MSSVWVHHTCVCSLPNFPQFRGRPNTNASVKDRVTNLQEFIGDVIPGRAYVVVDDTFTSGDTLISLIQHIVDGGGRVVAATTLADGRWQNYLKPRAEDVKIILDKLGLNEAEFHHEIGIPISQFTGSEIFQLAHLDRGWRTTADLRIRIFGKGSGATASRAGRNSRQPQKQEVVPPHQRERKPADHSVHDQEYRAADTPSTTQDDVRFSTTDQPLQSDIGFYSQVEHTIAGFKQMKATGDQWARWLEKQPGVKKEELDWLGIKEWLAERKGAVTKAEVMGFLRDNQVEVQEVEYSDRAQADQSPKYKRLQLPGGENYREVLLTLPDKSSLSEFTKEYLENNPGAREEEIRQQYEMYGAPLIWSNFNSPHFDVPNILAHVRMNERTDTDGKRVLFVEEVQSDWHQRGRQEGYKSQQIGPEIITDDVISTGKGTIPDAPFKQSWPMLAMKRVIRIAAEEGFDRVAWTTGEQQADRYYLRRYIYAIQILPSDTSTDAKK